MTQRQKDEVEETQMAMDPIVALIWLVVGVIAGWLSSRIVTGGGLGPIWDLIVGIVGAVIAGFTLPLLGFYTGGRLIAAIVNVVIGAVVFLAIARLCKLMLQPEKT
jgi:uncharacterized membrane protein YeaQ/YmgE (transglycosylase-associated protein family)